MINQPSNMELWKIALEREKLHRHHASSRKLSPDREYIGLCGERSLAMYMGFSMDLDLLVGGDKGVDFYTHAGTIDVKTAKSAIFLLREVKKGGSDIYVLARYTADDAALIGWEYDAKLVNAPRKWFSKEIESYYIHAKELRPMIDLRMKAKGAP